MATKKKTVKPITGDALRERSRPLLTCPATRNVYRVRMPDLEDVIAVGVLPDNFTAKALNGLRKSEGPPRELTDRDLLDVEILKRATVTAALLEPRVSENPSDSSEVAFKDIPPEDRDYIHLWATRQLPTTPVDLASGGLTSVAALENFSPEGQREQLVSDGINSGEGGGEAIPAVGNPG